MKVTAREAAIRLNVSYVVAAGLLAHLEEIGKATVVEKRFHSSGKGKPTRVYEVDQNVALDFGAEDAVVPVVPVAAAVAAPPTLEDVVESKVEERMAAMERLKSAVVPVAETPVAEEEPVPAPVAEEEAPVNDDDDDDDDDDFDDSDDVEDDSDVENFDDSDDSFDDDDDDDYDDAEAA